MSFVPNREDLARAAGFFNGEGCVHCTQPRRATGGHQFVLSIHQSVSDVEDGPAEDLIHFRDAVGGICQITGPYFNGSYKPVYTLKTGKFENIQAITAMLWPWLSWVKQLQYIEAKEKKERFDLTHPPRRKI